MNQAYSTFRFKDNHPPASDFLQEALSGLKSSPKTISPKFFYDEAGSRLFDQICQTPEYYPTRTEAGIIRDNLQEIAHCARKDCLIVEPGSGNSAKVRELLDVVRPRSYLPMDISKSFLRDEAQKLSREYPWLEVHAVCSDFTVSMELPDYSHDARKVVFFPGSSIGNFDPEFAADFLARIKDILGSDGGLLIGVDLKKEAKILNAAYNDRQGLTAAFNLNLLTRMNRELGADFELDAFDHVAFYNEKSGRIEMHLCSKKEQSVQVGECALEFSEGETIHTENSYKYTASEFENLAGGAGLNLEKLWTDDNNWFGLFYFTVAA